jgi:hypothetical protein
MYLMAGRHGTYSIAIHLAGEELVCSVAQTPRWSLLYAEEGRLCTGIAN